jgi:hypothetical protein
VSLCEKQSLYFSGLRFEKDLENTRNQLSTISINHDNLKAKADRLEQEALLKDSMISLNRQLVTDLRGMLDIQRQHYEAKIFKLSKRK